jgi:hypothetical protein
MVDIDGTLGDHHGHFKRCASMYTGREDILHRTPGHDFPRSLGLGKPLYREIKLAYRRGGWKRSMPVFPGASDLCRRIRRDAVLVLATTRPWLNHDGIDKDTVHWLRRNAIQYDYLFFGGQWKYRAAVKQYGGADMCAAVLDDLPPMIWQALDAGVQTAILMDGWHNKEVTDLARVYGMQGAQEAILEAIDNWRQQHAH